MTHGLWCEMMKCCIDVKTNSPVYNWKSKMGIRKLKYIMTNISTKTVYMTNPSSLGFRPSFITSLTYFEGIKKTYKIYILKTEVTQLLNLTLRCNWHMRLGNPPSHMCLLIFNYYLVISLLKKIIGFRKHLMNFLSTCHSTSRNLCTSSEHFQTRRCIT